MGESPKRVTLFGIGRLGICTALVLEKAGCGPLHLLTQTRCCLATPIFARPPKEGFRHVTVLISSILETFRLVACPN